VRRRLLTGPDPAGLRSTGAPAPRTGSPGGLPLTLPAEAARVPADDPAIGAGPARGPTSGRDLAAVFVLFVLVGLVYTYPLYRYFTSGIPYVRFPAPGAEVMRMAPSDSLQLYYWFWLMKDNLVGGSRLFTNPYEFDVTPVLPPQHYGFYQFPLSLLFVLLSPGGGAFAYNSMIVLSFPLAAAAMYLLVRLYTGQRAAAFVAGLIFALAPFRLGQLLGGHSNGFLFFFVPLTLYCYEMGRRGRGALFGALAGLCLASLGLTDVHLLYYLVLFSAAYWAVRIVEALELPWRPGLAALGRAATAPGAFGPPAVVGAVVSGVVILTLLRRGLPLPQVVLGAGAALAAVAALWLAAAFALVAREPAGGAPIAPAAALRRAAVTLSPLLILGLFAVRRLAETPGLGRRLLVAAALGVAVLGAPGVIGLVRDRWRRLRPLAPILGCVAVGMLVAVGSILWLRSTVIGGSFTVSGGRPYGLIARNSPALADLWTPTQAGDERAVYLGIVAALLALGGLSGWRSEPRARGTLLLYGGGFLGALALSLGPSLDGVLPIYRLFYTYVPYFNYPRSPARMMIVTFTALGVLAGYAVARLPRRARWGRAALVVLVVAIGLEYAPYRAIGITLMDTDNPLYRIVGQELGNSRFLAVPLFPGDSHQSSVYEFHVTMTGAHMINGYSPVVSRQYVEGIFDRLVNVNLGEIRPAEYALLRALRVKLLLVHEELFFWKVSPFPGALSAANLQASPYLVLRARAGDMSLFEVRDQPSGEAPRFTRTSVLGSLHEVEELSRRTGREVLDSEASNGRAVEGREGIDAPGYLAFGTLPAYPTGSYVAGFRLKLDGAPPPGGVAVVDVSADRGRTVLARREIAGTEFRRRGAYEEFDVAWSIDAPTRVEFRIYYAGRGTLAADRVYVSFQAERGIRPVYEAEDLVRQTGEVRADADASEGRAVYVHPGSAPGYALYGPYRRHPPGRYEAVFRLKVDGGASGDGEVALVDVSADRGRRELAARAVTAAMLAPAGGYRDVALPFTVDAPAVLELRVLHRGRADLWIDRVSVRTVEPAQ
jgi:hypothetical protein